MSRNVESGTVLVTGAARRLGRAIALDFARNGWNIGVHFHRGVEEAQELETEIESAGGSAALLEADLSQVSAVPRLMSECVERLGPPICLINNAAMFEWDSPATLTPESWDRHLGVNLRAPVLLAQAFSEQLPAGMQGNIVNMLDQKVLRLDPDFFSYTIAKSALWTATQTLAQAFAPRIRVNAVAPGPVLPSQRQSEEDFARECRETPLGRAASPEEICAAIRFLLASPSITGQMIAVDSGQHLGSRPGCPAG